MESRPGESAGARRTCPRTRRSRRRARHHLRQCGRSQGQRVLGHAERRLAAVRDRRRYRHSASARGCSRFVDTPGHANQLAPGKRPRVTLSPTLVLEGRRVLPGDVHPRRRQSGSGAAAGAAQHHRVRHDPAGSRRSARVSRREHFYSSFAFHEFVPGKVNLEGRMPKTTADALSRPGPQDHGRNATGATAPRPP